MSLRAVNISSKILLLSSPFLTLLGLYLIIRLSGIAYRSLLPWLRIGMLLLVGVWGVRVVFDRPNPDACMGVFYAFLFAYFWIEKRPKRQTSSH
jgi:hypothetical protein